MNKLFLFITLLQIAIVGVATKVNAMQPILHSFSGVRAEGMGNVRYTTGLYEENFFANPARATANPENRFQLPKVSVEAGSSAISAIKDLSKGTGLQQFANSVGNPLSARLQLIFPAYYDTSFITDQWAFAAGLIFGIETHSELSQTGTVDPTSMFNAGPAVTLARRLLEEDRLSVGMTMHTEYRMTLQDRVSVVDYLSGSSIRGRELGGNGFGVDFDIGTSFLPHWNWLGATYEVGFAINNILGGGYKNLGRPNKLWTDYPTPSNRTYNFGVSSRKESVWKLDYLLFAFEVTDIGNNLNGSIYRLLHLGTEARWGLFSGRLGVNQGYLCAGAGWDVGWMNVNLATYGEEMSLNAGGMEDRRYALDFGFQI